MGNVSHTNVKWISDEDTGYMTEQSPKGVSPGTLAFLLEHQQTVQN